jgi:hypothetical protein
MKKPCDDAGLYRVYAKLNQQTPKSRQLSIPAAVMAAAVFSSQTMELLDTCT